MSVLSLRNGGNPSGRRTSCGTWSRVVDATVAATFTDIRNIGATPGSEAVSIASDEHDLGPGADACFPL